VLAAVWAVVVITVGADWFARVRENGPLENVAKPAATVAIAALALVVSNGAEAATVVCALIGFTLCLVGDVALLPSVDRFIVGLGAFLLGHVAFVVMFVRLGAGEKAWGTLASLGMAALALTIGRRIVAGARKNSAALTVPVTAYLLVIAVMAVVGWSTGIAAAIAGSTLFVASDSILGWRRFVHQENWMSSAVMVTYHAALVGLALSLA